MLCTPLYIQNAQIKIRNNVQHFVFVKPEILQVKPALVINLSTGCKWLSMTGNQAFPVAAARIWNLEQSAIRSDVRKLLEKHLRLNLRHICSAPDFHD